MSSSQIWFERFEVSPLRGIDGGRDKTLNLMLGSFLEVFVLRETQRSHSIYQLWERCEKTRTS